ncbi:MAG TPA: cytochrome C [Aromatoleum sp.]|uniref:cytochrome C n=1 Tax=Aromatoleum sp. TaxID=2307007 RepID=UPI002B4733D3|nr:cytochrome C [Aromatoleum sp.]HJV28835.1 cytochrome C [Aromatoleum sp.]
MSGNIVPSRPRWPSLIKPAIACALLAASLSASAVPSFARQTKQECATCHVGSLGPQLTPYGMQFKLGGYTETTGETSPLPLSAMLIAGFTRTKDDLAEAPEHYRTNNNSAIGEASVFLAGKLYGNVGAFVQATWEGVSRRWAMDSMDVRYAGKTRIADEDVILGASFNNRPTVQDPLNTTPVWSFPFTSAPEDFAPVPEASPVIAGALDGRVFGLTGYVSTGSGLYAEAGGYRAASRRYLLDSNAIEDRSEAGQQLQGTAPYWRLAYIKDRTREKSRDMFSVGLFGMNSRLRDFNSSGPNDRFDDLGVDANYQYIGNRTHVFTAGGSYINERQTLRETPAEHRHLTLDQFKLTTSYHYDKTYGATLSRFDTRGSSDDVLYANRKPDSNGWIVQFDWTPFGKADSWLEPWINLRVGLQYTHYGKFDGTSAGASGNDSTYLFAWTAF